MDNKKGVGIREAYGFLVFTHAFIDRIRWRAGTSLGCTRQSAGACHHDSRLLERLSSGYLIYEFTQKYGCFVHTACLPFARILLMLVAVS